MKQLHQIICSMSCTRQSSVMDSRAKKILKLALSTTNLNERPENGRQQNDNNTIDSVSIEALAELERGKVGRLYEIHCAENETQPASEITYRRTFAAEFNLSFFKPKKDQCLICANYNKANSDEKKKQEENYIEHPNRKRECNLQKENDKIRANSEPDFKSVTFDLQALLQIPSSSENLLYYCRKLNVYNLTVYEADLPNRAFCFTWTEINGKRGSAEISSILHFYLSRCLPSEIKQISLFSDTCSGQNRNQYVAAMLLWCTQNIENLDVIEQKFLESGHTYMEVDSMHSSIETAKKNSPVYSMIDWTNIFHRARKEKVIKNKVTKENHKVKPYEVKEFKFHDFFDVKGLAENLIKNRTRDSDGNSVKWLKMKWLKFVKGEPYNIYFKYNMDDNFRSIIVNQPEPNVASKAYNTRRSRNRSPLSCSSQNTTEIQEWPKTALKTLYSKPLEISSAKKKDLLNLCRKGVIPEELHAWYNGLPSSTTIQDRVPELAVSDSEEERD